MGLFCTRMLVLVSLLLLPVVAECKLRYYKFDVVMQNFTKLCSTKSIVTVNGKFPGPTLYAREGDRIIVRVINHVQYNITIHWHGIRQLRSCWSDGPAYIAQCPIQPNQSYIYNFTITNQRGTLFWHAHISWLRATVHGPIIILPKRSVSYPFPKPYKQKTLVLSEWWKSDTETVINQAMQTGFPPNVSDAHTFNGHTGPTHNCSSSSLHDTLTLHVIHNKTYLLRIINTALNDEFFLKIANHNFTIVEVDASYTKPFTTDTIYIAPGQTTNALLTTNQPPGKYTIATHAFMDAPTVAVNNLTNYAILHYKTSSSTSIIPTTLPLINSTLSQSTFTDSLRSLNSITYPTTVPTTINHNLLFTVGVGVNPCSTCLNGSKLVGDINNVTFTLPSIAVLQAYYFNIPGVFTDDFPGRPLISFNYTGSPTPANLATMNGTRVYRVKYNETVQVVLQDTAMIAPESHPIHLHGYNFYVVGKGIGNFDPVIDSKRFNLIDPVERNTIDAPNGGWTAIRFRADNPGVWFMHCHLEVHTSWGLKMAFLVEDGDGPNHSLLPPPNDLPNC